MKIRYIHLAKLCVCLSLLLFLRTLWVRDTVYAENTESNIALEEKVESERTAGLKAVTSLPDITPHKCVNTSALHKGLRTVICVKDPRVDEWVSGGILASGVWEKEIVVEVMRTMDHYSEAVFMDIGSNIGMYTVMAAAMGRRVVAVDPIIGNLALVNSSLQLAGRSHLVSFINNPISDTVATLYPVTIHRANEGHTKLLPASLLTPALRAAISGEAVTSATLDQLISFARAKTVIIKLDVEGFECKVLRPYLSRKDKTVFIPYIFMEWAQIKVNLDNNCPDLRGLVTLLKENGYYPWDMINRTIINAEKAPHADIVWVHTEAEILI